MTTPTHDESIISLRRARVAQLKLRQLSSREIALALAQGDRDGNNRIVSPQTGKPYDHKVILADLKILQEEWKKDRLQDTDTHIDRQFAEINEVKRAGWAQSNPKLVLEGLDREMKLLGTSKPLEINFNFNLDVVVMLAAAIERRGESPSDWFLALLQEMSDAENEETVANYDSINTNTD